MPKPRIDLEELSRFFKTERKQMFRAGEGVLGEAGHLVLIDDFWFYLSKREYTIPSLDEWRRMCGIEQ